MMAGEGFFKALQSSAKKRMVPKKKQPEIQAAF
jgi:hypothetical protein